jgi:hypothetical protein
MLGRNQAIAAIAGGISIIGSWLAAKFMAPDQAQMWLDFAQVQVPAIIGLITLPSAAIKMKNGKSSA